jgi:hypothetical protein
MPALGFGLSLVGGVIIADFQLEGEDGVTINVFTLLQFRDLFTGHIDETAFRYCLSVAVPVFVCPSACIFRVTNYLFPIDSGRGSMRKPFSQY